MLGLLLADARTVRVRPAAGDSDVTDGEARAVYDAALAAERRRRFDAFQVGRSVGRSVDQSIGRRWVGRSVDRSVGRSVGGSVAQSIGQ